MPEVVAQSGISDQRACCGKVYVCEVSEELHAAIFEVGEQDTVFVLDSLAIRRSNVVFWVLFKTVGKAL